MTPALFAVVALTALILVALGYGGWGLINHGFNQEPDA